METHNKKTIGKIIKEFQKGKAGIDSYNEIIDYVKENNYKNIVVPTRSKKQMLINYILRIKKLVENNEITTLYGMDLIASQYYNIKYNLTNYKEESNCVSRGEVD